MNTLDETQHKALKLAIQTLERQVSGELVVVIAKASDTYRFIPTLWAALLALALPGVYLLRHVFYPQGWAGASGVPSDESGLTDVYFIQVALFFGTLMVLHWPPVLRFAVPSSVYRQRASRLAHEQFLMQRLHHTQERCGALVFISLLERHVEIMVDKGLAGAVPNSYWQETVSYMLPLLKRGDTADACLIAVEAIAKTMHQHCPRDANAPTRNELPDHVIEL